VFELIIVVFIIVRSPAALCICSEPTGGHRISVNAFHFVLPFWKHSSGLVAWFSTTTVIFIHYTTFSEVILYGLFDPRSITGKCRDLSFNNRLYAGFGVHPADCVKHRTGESLP
jgi:hypothetical protein